MSHLHFVSPNVIPLSVLKLWLSISTIRLDLKPRSNFLQLLFSLWLQALLSLNIYNKVAVHICGSSYACIAAAEIVIWVFKFQTPSSWLNKLDQDSLKSNFWIEHSNEDQLVAS